MGISARIGLATRLHNMERGGGEPFQIANYGIGGVYNHHPDPHGYHRPERPVREGEGFSVHLEGDRVATVMAYISKVSKGCEENTSCGVNLVRLYLYSYFMRFIPGEPRRRHCLPQRRCRNPA